MDEKVWAGVLLGSDSDLPVMEACLKALQSLGISFEVKVMSAHRTPEAVSDYVKSAASRGLKVLICAAGGAAHLAGAAAASTHLPVIGVPMNATPLGGLDALLSTVQMPPGVPVATVGIDRFGAVNAAVLAAEIIALADSKVKKTLLEYRAGFPVKIAAANERLNSALQEKGL